jgi:hypothetical protein
VRVVQGRNRNRNMVRTQSCQVIKTSRRTQAIRLRECKGWQEREEGRRKVNLKFTNFEICSSSPFSSSLIFY